MVQKCQREIQTKLGAVADSINELHCFPELQTERTLYMTNALIHVLTSIQKNVFVSGSFIPSPLSRPHGAPERWGSATMQLMITF